MKKSLLFALSVCLTVGLLAPEIVLAQEAEEEGPQGRYVTATIFEIPFNERSKVFPFMTERFLPGWQLNPHVRNLRVLTHNWGSNASEVVILAEYDSFADIDAECGAPCDEYYDANPAPEEGDEGFAEFDEQSTAFNKYYGKHKDEIYFTPLEEAVVEGQFQGTVGMEEEEEE